MTPPRTIARRVVIATALCALIGFFAAPLVARTMAGRGDVIWLQEPLAEYLWRTYEGARCGAAPASWSMVMKHGARSYAYDAVTLTSLNPAAPALDRSVWERVTRGPRRMAYQPRGATLSSESVVVFRATDRGPCAIVQTTWPAQSVRSVIEAWLPLGLVLAVVAAAAVGFFALALPLMRVERRRAALQRHLADLSHDLKTPIASLHLALEQAIHGNRDPDVGPLLGAAMNDAVYLSALTANLRLATEMREGWNPGASAIGADLTDVVDRVVTRARLAARPRGVEIDVAVPDAAIATACDPIAAEQAVSNIVDNAITHGERGGHVAVMLESSPDGFTLTVADDGPGVPPDELPRLGERMFRTDDARQRDASGRGLGLAITHEVCKRCGWQLAFERESPRGLRVTIRGARR